MRPERRFWIELSYRYHMPVRWLQKMLTPDDFDELWAEETIYPRGERREDARHAIRALIAARIGGVKDGDTADYIPKWKTATPEKPQTVDEAVRVAMKITAMMGGTFS